MKGKQRVLALLAALVLALPGCGGPGTAVIPTPAPTPAAAPAPLTGNGSAQMETSLLSRGLVYLRYTGGKEVRVKAQITKEGGTPYNYDLNAAGDWEGFSFTQGDGTYTVRVLENTTENRYLPVFSSDVEVELADPMAPFLSPNQFVNYTLDSQAVVRGREVTRAGTTDAERTALAFDWVVDTLTYDHEKADSVPAGYLPDVDAVLAQGKGICFDYAALLCAVLRSQGIPCRLQVGYAGSQYHAWVEVWCGTDGLVDGAIPITAKTWSRLDPTFVSGAERSAGILEYVTEDSHYRVSYTY